MPPVCWDNMLYTSVWRHPPSHRRTTNMLGINTLNTKASQFIGELWFNAHYYAMESLTRYIKHTRENVFRKVPHGWESRFCFKIKADLSLSSDLSGACSLNHPWPWASRRWRLAALHRVAPVIPGRGRHRLQRYRTCNQYRSTLLSLSLTLWGVANPPFSFRKYSR